MKAVLICMWVFAAQLFFTGHLKAQQAENTMLFRAYDDDDFFNIRGKGTDDAYTGGIRLDMFYTKNHKSRFLVDRVLPKAGDSAVNVFGWSVMQMTFTPMDIRTPVPQPFDYPWSGSLFAIHSLYSYNREKKYDFQTELLLGMMGPASFAAQTQTYIHQLIHYYKPLGWDNQLGNNPLVNVNFTAEKQIASQGNWLEVLAGGQASVGTEMNSLVVYPMVRIGKMHPYFNGYLSQYGTAKQHGVAKHRGGRVQAYIIIKPEVQLALSNSLLQGGIFATNTHAANGIQMSTVPINGLSTLVYQAYYGAVVSLGNFSLSFIQNSSTEWIKNTYSHEFGNVSLWFSW